MLSKLCLQYDVLFTTSTRVFLCLCFNVSSYENIDVELDGQE